MNLTANGFSNAQSTALQHLATQNQLGGVSDRSQSDMEVLCNRLSGMIDQAGVVTERLAQIDLRLTGGYAEKTAANPTPPRPVPNGHIMSLSMSLDELASRFDTIHQLLSRLGSAI